MNKSSSRKIIALLALAQGIFGLLRGYNWIQMGSDLFGQGLLLLPALGAVAFLRGFVIGVIALFYVLFSIGMARAKTWAWWPGITAAIANLIFVLSALVHGAPIGEAVVWLMVPVILIFYFFSAKTPNSDATV
jgi:hypothetical protein